MSSRQDSTRVRALAITSALIACVAIAIAIYLWIPIAPDFGTGSQTASQPFVAQPQADFVPIEDRSRELISTKRFVVQVQDSRGARILDARIISDGQVTSSDNHGLAVLSESPASLSITHLDFAPAHAQVSDLARQSGGLVVTMREGATLSIAIVNRERQPIAGATVDLSRGHAGGEAPEGASEMAVADNGLLLYRLTAVTDASGRAEFRGLAPGPHTMRPSLHGYTAALGLDRISEFDRFTLQVGSNAREALMLRVYGAAIAYRNLGPAPDTVLEAFGMIRMKYPAGLTDMPPSLIRVTRQHQKVIEGMLGGAASSWIKLAREDVNSSYQDQNVDVVSSWLGRMEVTTSTRFVPMSDFGPGDVKSVDVKTPVQFGQAVISAPFPVVLLYKVNGKTTHMRRSVEQMNGQEVTLDLPVGEYSVLPLEETLLSSRRAKSLRVSADQIARIDFSDEPPWGRLRVSIADAAGRPTTGFDLRITKLIRPWREIMISGAGGPDIDLFCEPSSYRLILQDAGFHVINTQEVEVLPGETKSVKLKMN